MIEIAGRIDIVNSSYKWTITHFSKYNKIGDYIKSPMFYFVENDIEVQWQIVLFPCGCDDYPDYLIFYPRRKNKKRPTMKISLINYKKENEAITFAKRGPICDNSLYIKRNDAKKFLKNNKLQITCELVCDYESQSIEIEKRALERLNYLDDIEKLLLDNKYSDVEIVVDGGKVLGAHKCLLASKSFVFEDMFASKENQGRCRITINVSYEACKEMLRYLYVGKVNKLDGIVYQLAEVADKYCIEGLKNVCEDYFLNTNCNFAEAIVLLKLADVYKMDALKKKILKFIAQNGKEVIKEPSFELVTTGWFIPPHLLFDLFDAIIHVDEYK